MASTVDIVDPFDDGSGVALFQFNVDGNDLGGNYLGDISGSATLEDGGVFDKCLNTLNMSDSQCIITPEVPVVAFSIHMSIGVFRNNGILVKGDTDITIVGNGSAGEIYFSLDTNLISTNRVADEWFFIYGEDDGAGIITFYVDDEPPVSFAGNLVSIDCIGSGDTGYSNTARFDQLRMFSRVLTKEEREAIRIEDVVQPTNKPIFGSTEVSNFMVGDTQVNKVMVGSELLWNNSTELGCDPFGDGSGLLYDKLDNALVNECGGDIVGVWDGTEEYCPDGLKDACACNFLANASFISYDIATPPVSWTISMWFKIANDATNVGNQTVFSINDGTARYSFNGVDGMEIQPQNIGESISIPIDIDTWYNISIVYDGTKYIHYLDSVWQQDFEGVSSLTTLTLGGFISSSQLLEGSTDEVRLFNRALTAEEIEIIYNDGVNT